MMLLLFHVDWAITVAKVFGKFSYWNQNQVYLCDKRENHWGFFTFMLLSICLRMTEANLFCCRCFFRSLPDPGPNQQPPSQPWWVTSACKPFFPECSLHLEGHRNLSPESSPVWKAVCASLVKRSVVHRQQGLLVGSSAHWLKALLENKCVPCIFVQRFMLTVKTQVEAVVRRDALRYSSYRARE